MSFHALSRYWITRGRGIKANPAFGMGTFTDLGGSDGWGRAFSQGLLCAVSGGYDYVVHVEGDLLTRLDVPAICRMMQERRIDALSAVTPLLGWLETGLVPSAKCSISSLRRFQPIWLKIVEALERIHT